jgi:uncharacterized LabA/DUF88 family protein
MNSPTISPPDPVRVRIFVDFWNFTLAVRNMDASLQVDWRKLGPVLATEAGRLIDAKRPAQYEGLHVYGSFDPAKSNDAKLKNWFTNTLDKMPGVHVVLLERQRKRGYPRCPHCQTETTKCHACGHDMRGTEEKGVDTRIVTDMISLAWANSYDAAVLVSADRDFVPVADFLQTKGIKVIHGAFPPLGSQLSQRCWANIAIPTLAAQIKR